LKYKWKQKLNDNDKNLGKRKKTLQTRSHLNAEVSTVDVVTQE